MSSHTGYKLLRLRARENSRRRPGNATLEKRGPEAEGETSISEADGSRSQAKTTGGTFEDPVRFSAVTKERAVYMYQIDFLCLSPPVASRFSRCRLRGTQRARAYTTAQLWPPAGLRGTCSQRPESRNLAISRAGIHSGLLEPSRPMGTPQQTLRVMLHTSHQACSTTSTGHVV